MGSLIPKQLILLAVSAFVACGCATSRKQTAPPLMTDVRALMEVKKNPSQEKLFRATKAQGDRQLGEDNIIVIDKVASFAPDKHFYCSIGPYWWPDSQQSGKYINRDGYVNPESAQYDRGRLSSLASRCQNLSEAYYLTKNVEYYNAFIKQLDAWFIDKETFMYPNFEYSQVIPGQRGNKGRNTGMIEAYSFNIVIESIRLVNSVKKLDKQKLIALKTWFYEFAEWAETGEVGESLRKSNTNVALAYDVIIANMYLFAGEEAKAKLIVDDFEDRRINVQIKEDGSQPNELQRTKAFSYSLFNLTHIIDMCFLARYWYPNYYLEHRERIDKAFEFLGQYVDNTESFPYQQISDWDKCKKNYRKQLERVEKLRANGNN